MLVCPYTQTQFKIDALVFFSLLGCYIFYVNELCSVRFSRTFFSVILSWFASAKVKNFFQTTKTFLKFFLLTSKPFLSMFFQSLLRSPTLVRGCKDNLFLFPGKLFGMFFETPLKNISNPYLSTVLLRCSSLDSRLQKYTLFPQTQTYSTKIKQLFDNSTEHQVL